MRDRKINFRSLTGKIHIAEINAFVKLVPGIFTPVSDILIGKLLRITWSL